MRKTAWLLAALLGLALTAQAATVQQLPFQALIQQAERIVQIKVTSLETEVIDGRAFTLAKCRILTTFKGKHESQISLRLPGGKVGAFTMIAPGSPTLQLRENEEMVAFLAKDENPQAKAVAWQPLGLGHGLFLRMQKGEKHYAIPRMENGPQHFADCDMPGDDCLRAGTVWGLEWNEFIAQIKAGVASLQAQ